MKEKKGVTLLALTIALIIMILLAGTTVSLFGGNGTIKNTENALDQSKIESMRAEIELAIAKKIVIEDNDVTIEQIIEELENVGIINEGDSNPNNGQVKTQPDGYIYEIKEEANGNWKVEYVEQGEIDKSAIKISVTGNTTNATNKVTLKIKGSSLAGITKYTPGVGKEKTYASGTTQIEETCEITANGTYTFTIKNKDGKTASKTITINNIITGAIKISATPTKLTNGNVTVTVTWPTGTGTVIKQISTNGGTSWSTYTGNTSTVTVSNNCTVKARVVSGSEEIKTATITINNIDKTKPTVTAKQASVTITEGDSNELSTYFTIVANGSSKITNIKYVDTSNSNSTVTNTNTLSKGTHIIKCTATKETGTTASATVTIEVKNKQTITSADYGATINGYNCENSAAVANWKIFYADENNVYIIADNYIHVDYVPNEPSSENNGWEISLISSSYTGSENITDTRIQNLNKSYFDYLKTNSITTTNRSIKQTAYLTDINAWSVFAGEKAEYAIGGPTIELFFKSYNQKYNTNLQADVSDWLDTGTIWYGVSDDGGATWNGHSNDILLNTNDSLYVINETSRARGMYLASPAQSRMAGCLRCLV